MVSMVVAVNVKTMKIWEGHGDGLVVDVSQKWRSNMDLVTF